MKKGNNFIDILLISLLVILIGVLISSIFSTIEIFKIQDKQETNSMPQRMSRMSLTGFDKELARQLMDQNNDGRCDACGMPVEQCIDAGELQCNMGINAQMGVLGSQHIHADWKFYINGDLLELKEYKKKYPQLQNTIFAVGQDKILIDYRVTKTTTKYAIDRNGKIIYAGFGAFDEEQWKILLDELSK